jgi:hypothetical protein
MLQSIRPGLATALSHDLSSSPEPTQLNQSISPRTEVHIAAASSAASPAIAQKPKEDQNQMSTVTPKTLAAAARLCTHCKKNPLSYNNSTGICGECQRELGGRVRPKKTNGHVAQPHRGLQLERQAQPAPPEQTKPNGADNARGNGDVRLLATTYVDARVNQILNLIPREDKARMLAAWLAGTL